MQGKTPKRFREAIERARGQVETVMGVLERHSNEKDWNLGPEFTKASADLRTLLERNAVRQNTRWRWWVVSRWASQPS